MPLSSLSAQSRSGPSTSTKPASLTDPPRRTRWSWGEIFSLFYLPRYDGRHNVATLTLELPIPASVPVPLPVPLRVKEPWGKPAFELSNALTTIYYPTDAKRPASPRLTWITLAQIKGYLKFACLTLPQRIVALPLALFATACIKLPTLGAAPIVSCTTTSKHPLVLFCHGLTGNRTCYSQYCGQLASRGYVVAAIEHRDRSGAHTIINSSPPVQLPYIDMDDLTDDSRPDNYLIARAYQLEIRVSELLAVSELLTTFGTPDGWKSIKQANLRVKGSLGYAGDDGKKWSDQDWHQFGSAVNWQTDVVLAGHSFGSATVFAASRYSKPPQHWSKLVMLDPWLETLDYWPNSAPSLEPGESVEMPILVINSPGFTAWPGHFDPLYNFLKARSGHHLTWFFTIAGIIHSSFSDLPIIFERLWRMRGQLKLDSQKALDLAVRASIEFMMGSEGDVLVRQSTTRDSRGIQETPAGEVVFHVQPKECT